MCYPALDKRNFKSYSSHISIPIIQDETEVILSCLLQVAYTVLISCPDQSPSYECPADAAECEFDFRVNEHFSFESYALDNDQQLTVSTS